jgi:uncharacterized protein (UPF0248 family)
MRKGLLQEIISKAMYADDINTYIVCYRDMDTLKEVTLKDFLGLSENFQLIPASRIVYIKRGDKIIYSKRSNR